MRAVPAATRQGPALMAAQAQLRQAQINLGYTNIEAPIAGKIGRSTFTEGSFVGPTAARSPPW